VAGAEVLRSPGGTATGSDISPGLRVTSAPATQPESGDVVVFTDVQLLHQILGNLIDNACKYSRGAEDHRIWVRARNEGRRLILEVEDRGPGVSPRDGASIFRPFRRGIDADVTAGGVGLGLALAQRWAELLGGTLTLCGRRENLGACFRLVLPL